MEIVLFVYNCCVLYIKNLVIYHFALTFFFFLRNGLSGVLELSM